MNAKIIVKKLIKMLKCWKFSILNRLRYCATWHFIKYLAIYWS